MKAYLISLRFHWGYSIRNFFSSKMADSYTLPPIGTLTGAITRAKKVTAGDRVETQNNSSAVINFLGLIKDYAISVEEKPVKFTTL
ncbi:MAG: CRISPR-associated protein Cas5, partial [Fervidicoccus fontis]